MQKLCWKRLQKEKLNSEKPSKDLILKPINSRMTRWHFTFFGPKDTVYEEGVYHGVLLIPRTYPYSPPDIVLLTRSGRYEIRRRLCLSVTSFHHEEWTPVWTLEEIIRAFRSQFESKDLILLFVGSFRCTVSLAFSGRKLQVVQE